MKKIFLLALGVIMMLNVIGCAADDATVSQEESVDQSAESEEVVSDDDRTYKLTDTGQKAAYGLDGEAMTTKQGEALYGQDSDYEGTQASFTDNGDGTVTDNVTGLVWQQIPVSETMSWEEAEEYCESLELGGYDDWRVPTAKELFGISDFSTGWPYLDTDHFGFAEYSGIDSGPGGAPQGDVPDGEAPQGGAPQGGAPQGGAPGSEADSNDSEMPPPPTDEDLGENGVSKAQGQFWSSNFYYAGTTHGGADTAFGVNHATGHIKGYPSDVSGQMGKYVRAVRGEVSTINNFVDNGDGTISDLSTGLMWMMDDNGEGVEWEDALAYSEDLDFAGYDDWRLPDVKELQSIVDYSGTYPAIDDELFNCSELEENENYYFWTSTSAYFSNSEPDYYYAWYVAFGYAVNDEGEDVHGAGAVRFSAKYADSPATAEGGDNFMNSVRAVRTID